MKFIRSIAHVSKAHILHIFCITQLLITPLVLLSKCQVKSGAKNTSTRYQNSNSISAHNVCQHFLLNAQNSASRPWSSLGHQYLLIKFIRAEHEPDGITGRVTNYFKRYFPSKVSTQKSLVTFGKKYQISQEKTDFLENFGYHNAKILLEINKFTHFFLWNDQQFKSC